MEMQNLSGIRAKKSWDNIHLKEAFLYQWLEKMEDAFPQKEPGLEKEPAFAEKHIEKLMVYPEYGEIRRKPDSRIFRKNWIDTAPSCGK